MYEYQWYQWTLFFFCYCFFGWIFESGYVSLKKRCFVNRGFLRLPMLPLYGTGAVMMLFVSLPVKNDLVLVYFLGVLAATALEYVTGWGMEKLFKMRYWDYRDQKFNVNGYICLSSSIAWGFLTIFLTEVIHKPVERLVLGIDEGLAYGIVGIVGTVFVADVIESTKAALELGQALEAMARMRRELEEMQVQFALLKCELRDQAEQSLERLQKEAALHLAELRRENDARMEGIRDHVLAEKIRLLEEKAEKHREKARLWRERLSGLQKFYFKGILEGNRLSIPGGYKEMLDELREELKKKKGK
ncbi:MAG: hypothetical protein HFG47_12900 [Lachnospiraceae bacterium]|nr:hypothetical protein [Lachnospiraceae bacterium]